MSMVSNGLFCKLGMAGSVNFRGMNVTADRLSDSAPGSSWMRAGSSLHYLQSPLVPLGGVGPILQGHVPWRG